MHTRYYLVKGRVQGVSFRYYIQKRAIALNISGTVQNLFDGDVEIYAQGTPENLEAFEKHVQSGPPLARVTGIQKEILELPRDFSGFDILY